MDRVATFARGIVLVSVVVVDEAVLELPSVSERERAGEVAKCEPSKVDDLPELTAVSQSGGRVTADHSSRLDPGRQDRHREGQ